MKSKWIENKKSEGCLLWIVIIYSFFHFSQFLLAEYIVIYKLGFSFAKVVFHLFLVFVSFRIFWFHSVHLLLAVGIKLIPWHAKYTERIIKKVTCLWWIWKYCNLADLDIPLPTMYHMYMFVMKQNTKNGIVWAKNGHFRPIFVRNANFDNFELWYILS